MSNVRIHKYQYQRSYTTTEKTDIEVVYKTNTHNTQK